MTALWSVLRSNKAVFKASDGNVIDVAPNEITISDLNHAAVAELPSDVAWLQRTITTESGRFLFLRQAAFDIVELIFAHYDKGRAGMVVTSVPSLSHFGVELCIFSHR